MSRLHEGEKYIFPQIQPPEGVEYYTRTLVVMAFNLKAMPVLLGSVKRVTCYQDYGAICMQCAQASERGV